MSFDKSNLFLLRYRLKEGKIKMSKEEIERLRKKILHYFRTGNGNHAFKLLQK